MNKILISLITFIGLACTTDKTDRLKNTIYKMGFKTDSSSTGPLDNSAFVLKMKGKPSPLLLTAHHTVAGIGNEKYLKWNEIASIQKNAWAWSMHDSTVNFKVGKNLPIKGAETLRLDIAAFYLPNDEIPFLQPARKAAQLGDTVFLYSKIVYQNKPSLLNRGVVIYKTDSVMIYELTDFHMARIMGGTSGSCVINREGEVVSNSYAGFTIPNDEIKQQLEQRFSLLKRIQTSEGKSYGVGAPIALIEASLILALNTHEIIR